jgi:ParB-like chromosome segregation protein Spo0J
VSGSPGLDFTVREDAYAMPVNEPENAVPSRLHAQILDWLRKANTLPDRVDRVNQIRQLISSASPFASEPVDCVLWVPAETVIANDYNPNTVAPPEMDLLRLSIMADGYTQPIVTNSEAGERIVVDGFHRNRVGKECEDVRARVQGFLPVVQIRAAQTDKPDRMASTIRHNRARGKHQVEGMSEIVLELKRRNWSDAKIGKELGMDPDEVLRLAQITGLAEAFKGRAFSLAWEAEVATAEDDDLREVDES